MIQDIAPHTYDPVFRRKKPEDRDYLLHYEYNKVMLIKSGRGSVIPTFGERGAEGDFSAQAEYLFSIDDRAYYCVTDMKVPEFPKIRPAVIVAITNWDKLLMSRYARGAYRNYALIAGFVEIGETFEDCVRREVMEEVGLRVKNIRYYKSQPWAFSDTEMVGFTAELDGDDTLCLEEEELCEAGWFTRDEIVEYGPYISVGHEMMKSFNDGKI